MRNPYFGFRTKAEAKREDVKDWETVQKNYSPPPKKKSDQYWIWKDFIGNKYWDNASGIKDLQNGKTLNNFSIMFDEAIDCVKGLDI